MASALLKVVRPAPFLAKVSHTPDEVVPYSASQRSQAARVDRRRTGNPLWVAVASHSSPKSPCRMPITLLRLSDILISSPTLTEEVQICFASQRLTELPHAETQTTAYS